MVAWLEPRNWKGPRRALASLVMCFFALLYGVVALNAGGEWRAALLGLGACYLVGFAGIVAPWFWGRWFASGLCWSGALIGALSLVMNGWAWPLALYAGLHGAVILGLAGKTMSGDYELQSGWRERFRMDDLGVARLGKTVTRTAASLPSVVLWALGPKEPGQGMTLAVGVLALATAFVGVRGLVRLRTWGLFATAAAVLVAGRLGSFPHAPLSPRGGCEQSSAEYLVASVLEPFSSALSSWGTAVAPYLAVALALAILFPFLQPMRRHLRR